MRACALTLAALLSTACGIERERTPDAALRSACQYLWRQQSADGGWHSHTYGLMRSGQSLTPFTLNALLNVANVSREEPPGAVDRAISFLNRNTNSEGAVGKMDPRLYDYPNYSTALTVLALRRAARPGWQEQTARLAAWLTSQQFTESHGWKPDDAAYGGWGIGGEARDAPYSGHVDLSMTRHVLQALAAAGARPGDPVFARARIFVGHCQNPDGGFFYSPVVVDANKAGQEGSRYRSYGTATADGVLALQAMGVTADDERLRCARQWLVAHDRPDGAPGFIGPAYHRWTAGMRFYYAGVGAEALGRCSRELAASLILAERRDGSWRNSETVGKEDDPLIATSLAVVALVRASER